MNTAIITQDELDKHKVDRHKLLLDRGIPMDQINGTWVLDNKRYEIGIELVQNRLLPGVVRYRYTWARKDYAEKEITTQVN